MKAFNFLLPVVLLASCATTPPSTPSARFKLADQDQNNLVSRQEATNLIVGDAFKMFDTNGDGVIELEEYKASGGTEEKFRRVNKSGTGKLTLDEALSEPLVVKNFTVSFDEADTDNDGNLTFEEYTDYLQRRDEAVR